MSISTPGFRSPRSSPDADLFIHHGGNNSFCEALYFGVPSLVMPYCWDGHDNAERADETGVGLRLDRASWTPTELTAAIASLLGDRSMRDRLRTNAATWLPHPARRAADAMLGLTVRPRPA